MNLKIFTSRSSLQNFVKNQPLDLILGAGSQQTKKLNQLPQKPRIFMKICKDDLLVIYLQIHRRNLPYLPSK